MNIKPLWGSSFFRRMTLLLLLCFGLSGASFAQSEWTAVADSGNVSISCKQITCNNKSYVVLNIQNNNNMPVTLKWKAWGTGPAESFTLSANENAVGTCSSGVNLKLEILPGYAMSSFISSFLFTYLSNQ